LRLLRQQEREAAATVFVRYAGARVVALCRAGHPSAETFTAIFVPKANDDVQFRSALHTLGLDAVPVLIRTDPLESFQRLITGSQEFAQGRDTAEF
jgi:hypothetical protein